MLERGDACDAPALLDDVRDTAFAVYSLYRATAGERCAQEREREDLEDYRETVQRWVADRTTCAALDYLSMQKVTESWRIAIIAEHQRRLDPLCVAERDAKRQKELRSRVSMMIESGAACDAAEMLDDVQYTNATLYSEFRYPAGNKCRQEQDREEIDRYRKTVQLWVEGRTACAALNYLSLQRVTAQWRIAIFAEHQKRLGPLCVAERADSAKRAREAAILTNERIERERREHRRRSRPSEACSEDNAIEELVDRGETEIETRFKEGGTDAIVAVKAEFEACIARRVRSCQRHVASGDLDAAARCWEKRKWWEVRVGEKREDYARVPSCIRQLAGRESELRRCLALPRQTKLHLQEKADCLKRHASVPVQKCPPLQTTGFFSGLERQLGFENEQMVVRQALAPYLCRDALKHSSDLLDSEDVKGANQAISRASKHCRGGPEKKKTALLARRSKETERKLQRLLKKCGGKSTIMLNLGLKLGRVTENRARGCIVLAEPWEVVNRTDGWVLVTPMAKWKSSPKSIKTRRIDDV